MIINSFQINETSQLTPLAPEQAAEASQKADARIWLDLQDFEPDELEAWLDTLGIDDLSRRLCLEARDRAGFYPLKKEIFLVIPVLADTENKSDVDYLALLCRENLLLTLHRKSIMSLKNLTSLQDSDAWLSERSIAGLASAMMIDLSLGFLQHTAELRESVRALDERMDRDPDAVEIEEIQDIRAEFLALGAVVSDQLPSVKALSETDKPFFKLADARDYMNCALANLLATNGSLDWLDKQISDLRSGFQMHAQDKTNRRLNLLTILSAIFSPLSFLAGLWGMNFVNMPELKYAFSYPIALGLMSLVGWGMVFYFRKTGWLD